jgi:hypothetical protein
VYLSTLQDALIQEEVLVENTYTSMKWTREKH